MYFEFTHELSVGLKASLGTKEGPMEVAVLEIKVLSSFQTPPWSEHPLSPHLSNYYVAMAVLQKAFELVNHFLKPTVVLWFSIS